MRSLLICIAMLFAQQATAAVTINLSENGGNVQAVLSGSLNLGATGGFSGNSTGYNGYIASSGGLSFTTADSDYYAIDVGTWTPFGTGGFGSWDSSSGDVWHMFTDPVIGVPVGYVSGNPLSATATKNGTTFAALGFTPGTYVTTLTGIGGTDTVTVIVGAANLAPTPPPVITSPSDGAAVTVEGQATDPFVPMWSASTDPEGAPLEYTWELWTPGPTTLLLSVPTGAATQADLTMGAVAGLLAANGVAIGGSIDLVHRAVVNDGTNDVAGPTAAVNLTLANLEPTPPVITSPPDGATVVIEGLPTDPFVPMWSASTDPEGDALQYTWELWTPGPGVMLLSVPVGSATQVNLTMGAVYDLLLANGLNGLESIDLVHRAVVTDGVNVVAGPTADVTLELVYVGYPVPTMGQLGLLIMVLLMALAGFAGYRRLHA
jgi:hypothetical protein